MRKNIIIPDTKTSRKIIYFDESGDSKMPVEPISNNYPKRYFIYTAVIFNNYDIHNFEKYYFSLKRRFFNTTIQIHSTEFFGKDITKEKKQFVKSLADMISYGYNLEKYKRLRMTSLYRPIREVIERRRKMIKEEYGIDYVENI